MTIEAQLFSRLTGFAGLTALIDSRVFPSEVPQDAAMPAISYFRVSAERPSAMGKDTGIVFARYQFDSWGNSHKSARAVFEQLRQALQRYRTAAGDQEIIDIFVITDRDDHEEKSKTFRVIAEFEVQYRE